MQQHFSLLLVLAIFTAFIAASDFYENHYLDDQAFEEQFDDEEVLGVKEKPSDWQHLRDLFKLRSAGGACFHPHKNEVTYVSNQDGVLQLYSARFSKKGYLLSQPKRLFQTRNRCSAPRYLRDGSILFLHDRGGNENFAIGLFTPQGKQIWVLDQDGVKHLPNAITKSNFYFTSNARNKKKMDIYRRKMPLDVPANAEIVYTPDNGFARATLVFKDESHAIIEQHYSNVNSELLLVNFATGQKQHLTRPLNGDKPTRWSSVRFLKSDHSRILVRTDYQSDFFRFAILEFPNGDFSKPVFKTIPQMEAVKHDVSGVSSNARTRFSYIEINENGYSTLLRARMSVNGFDGPLVRIALPLQKSVIVHGDSRSFGRGMAISRDGRLMAMTLSNSVSPLAIWMFNLNPKYADHPKAWKLLPDALPASLKHAKFTHESLESYKSFDGLKVPYFFYAPKGKAPKGGWPVIIRLHGGPESQTRPSFDAITQFFLRAGFAIATPNIRGSKGYGKTYMDMDNREKRMNAIADIKYLALSLPKQHSNVNGHKLVVMGGSYGGYATLMAIVTYPELWKAGIDIVGMSNLVTFFKHTAEWRRKLRADEYGDYHTQQDLLKKISPINYVEKTRAPVFIIQGTNDERVPASEARQIYSRLQQVGKEPGKSQVANSKLMLFDNEGHGLSLRSNRLKAFHAVLKFLRKNVQRA